MTDSYVRPEGDLKDVSAGGLYMRLAEAVERGAALTAEVALCARPERPSVSGRALRVERLIGVRRGVAVAYDRQQFVAVEGSTGGADAPLATE